MKRLVVILALLGAACSARTGTTPSETNVPSVPPGVATSTSNSPGVSSTRGVTTSQAPPSSPATTSRPTGPSTTAIITTTSAAPATAVTQPGSQDAEALTIRLRFRSEVDDTSSSAFAAAAMATLTDPRGWGRSGFSFVADDASELTVVLAEPERVDALCLPLETKGNASCQNGPIVALNARLWREASDDWDASVDDYRTYLVNHEVGHLIGLRHPADRCPEGEPVSAVMEPQTGGLVCAGNGWPLGWEVEWAANRPAEIGPLPDWDGPRPQWP